MTMDGENAVASPRASIADDGDHEARASTASALRRSKRESLSKSDPTKTASNGQEDAAQQQRRSQRSVKSTYATGATPVKEAPSPREVVGKKPVKAAMEDAESESALQRRSRHLRVAASAIEATLVSTAIVPASPVDEDVEAPHEEEKEPVATPPRNRRPSRRQAEFDATGLRSPVKRTHLILGKFTANDAAALCEVVWYQMKENSYKSDVLLREKSPACIDWPRVSDRLSRSHEVTLAPRDCQSLWKFLAYAQDVGVAHGEEADLLDDSDAEDYELTAHDINKRVAASREVGHAESAPAPEPAPANDDGMAVPTPEEALPETNESGEPAEVAVIAPTPRESTQAPMVLHAPKDPTDGQADMPATVENRSTLRTAGIQLFPQYDQPVGIPEGWQRPFALKQSLPLVFIAEKFLKRKATIASSGNGAGESSGGQGSEVDPRVLAAAALSVTLTGEKQQPKPKRKRAVDGENGEGTAEKKPKKPRKKKEPGAAAAGKAPSAAATLAVAAAPKSSMPGRQAYVPSNTPPPPPAPARAAFDFFCKMYKENPHIMRASGAEEKKEPLPTGTLQPAQLHVVYASAPLHVRTACEQMANDDLRRFEREQLRRRLWEKARASLNNSPAPSPALSAPSTPAPVPAPAAPSGEATKAADSQAAAAPRGVHVEATADTEMKAVVTAAVDAAMGSMMDSIAGISSTTSQIGDVVVPPTTES